ncbi:hypothetical protein SAMN05444365_105107 [Micromonospora pattaloongensis]|uniref:Uncharacterized protein n=1 Tax=Micromonospora pattaloongensis TaxID=405436 RepID=A0A1H3PY95_9ACTN|nr:hypothetical protein [Micromonospora pattaloongensis]SDZ06046.1 hypothetical protein SAMN05444365_105107 [Micromonospora pattaloongensis]
MTPLTWSSAGFLGLAVFLLVLPRTAPARWIGAQFRAAPRAVAAMWGLLGAGGLTLVASERWESARTVLSIGSTVLSIAGIGALVTLAAIATKRKRHEEAQRQGPPTTPISDLLD